MKAVTVNEISRSKDSLKSIGVGKEWKNRGYTIMVDRFPGVGKSLHPAQDDKSSFIKNIVKTVAGVMNCEGSEVLTSYNVDPDEMARVYDTVDSMLETFKDYVIKRSTNNTVEYRLKCNEDAGICILDAGIPEFGVVFRRVFVRHVV